MKFVFFVEGSTERFALPGFLKRWLDPRLSQPVGIKIVQFEGWHDYVREIGKKVGLNLSGRAGADMIAAIGLLDLFGPTFYPNAAVTAVERYAWAKDHIENRVNHQRFHQHFAVHELEAWLLADPNILPEEVRLALPGNAGQPETVNFDVPPSRLLARLYWERLRMTYKKVTDGSNLFQALEPDLAYGKCGYLKRLLDDMLALAKAAGL